MLKNDPRLSLIRTWLTRDLGWRIGRISVASADASFRRYFRVSRGDVDPAAWAPKADTLIVMDAPPGKEDIGPYLKVSGLLEQAGAHVPHVHASDARRGLLAMEDLGDTQYLSVLKGGRGVDKLYGEALTTLANIQVRGLKAAQQLAPYDREPLERELNLMPEWFLGKHLRLELSPEERALLTVTFEFLINEALLQPQVFVHRDYHSRNLMVLGPDNKGGPGVIDFQDALRGPIGYDLVSLLKDCYISWSRERVERWVKGYRRVLGNLGANVGDSEYQFLRWFDLIGVQRHLKVLGIFARLWHRDGKIGYLADLPLTFEYVRDACRRYRELVEFERWLEWRVAPLLEPANVRERGRAAAREAKTAAAREGKTAAAREGKTAAAREGKTAAAREAKTAATRERGSAPARDQRTTAARAQTAAAGRAAKKARRKKPTSPKPARKKAARKNRARSKSARRKVVRRKPAVQRRKRRVAAKPARSRTSRAAKRTARRAGTRKRRSRK